MKKYITMFVSFGAMAFAFDVAAKTLTWAGGANGTWDKTSSSIWKEGGVYADGDDVVFDSNAIVTIPENVAPATITVTNSTVVLNCEDTVTALTGATTVAHDAGLTIKGNGLKTLGSIIVPRVAVGDAKYTGNLTIDADAVTSCGTIKCEAQDLTISCAVAESAQRINYTRFVHFNLTVTVGENVADIPKFTGSKISLVDVNQSSIHLTKSGSGAMISEYRNTYKTTVKEGVLKFDGVSAGLYKGIFTVHDGATLDVNDTKGSLCQVVLQKGAKLINSGVSGLAKSVTQLTSIELTGDATVETSEMFGVLNTGYTETRLTMNGYTLTKTGPEALLLFNTTITSGTIDIQEGDLNVTSGFNESSDTNFKVTIPAKERVVIKNGNTEQTPNLFEQTFKNGVKHPIAIEGTLVKTGAGGLKIEADIACAAGTGALEVKEGTLTVTGNAAYAGNLTIADGATLADDVTLPQEAVLSGKGTINGALTLEEYSVVDITQGSLSIHGSVTAKGLPVVKMNELPSTKTQPKLFGLTNAAATEFTPFMVDVMVGDKSYGEYKTMKKADGIYLCSKGLIIIIK